MTKIETTSKLTVELQDISRFINERKYQKKSNNARNSKTWQKLKCG